MEFEQLVEEHYQGLYRFALSLSRRPADASDLTQQTFVLWAEKGHQLRDRRKAKSWLFTTLYREFLKSKRRNQRFPHLELEEAETELPVVTASAIQQLQAEEVMDTLRELDETFRVPLSLFYVGDHSYKEIAAILDVPMGTVMSRISRGKEQLQGLLALKISASDLSEMTVEERRGAV